MFGLRISLLVMLASCATAAGEEQDMVSPPDAREASGFPDARPQSDAAPQPDARLQVTMDASIPVGGDAGDGVFCEDSSTCSAGTCCFSLGGPGFCTAGEEQFGVCLPD